MNTIRSATVVLVVALVACSREGPLPPLPAPTPEPSAELVEEFARDPERLKEVRRLCREEPDAVSDELCVASAQATRRRFMGEGKTKYTPEPAALPEAGSSAPKDE